MCNWIIQNSWLTAEEATKAQRESRWVALLLLNLGDRCMWVVSALPWLLYPVKRDPVTHCVGGWVGPRGSLAPTGIQSPNRPSCSELLYQLPSSKCDTPYTTYGPRSHTKYEVLLAKFPSQACESQRNSRQL